MTALEQKLMDELELLERDREADREAFRQSLKDLNKREENDEDDLIQYLKTLTEQNRQIIKLLETPPKSGDVTDKLKPILTEFFDTLQANLLESNQRLIAEIQNSTA